MRFAKISGMVGAVAAAALVLSACDSGSSKPASAAATSPSAAQPGAPSASASPTGPDGEKYLAAFLKPADFSNGLYSVDGYPNWDNQDTGDVQGLAALDCYDLENGGEASGSTMQAYDVMTTSGPNQDFATQKVYTFNTGDAIKMVQYVELRASDDCSAFDHTPDGGGAKTHTTMTAKELQGLGDQALLVTATDQPDGGQAATLSALMVRYGDVVVYVSFSNADANKVKAFDLASREQTIAKNLNLG